ncbi:MAG: aminoglycoside phosphotransferase family protein [Bacteroides sp.]|nr:aminoglycoside phosphotransferase family protein [Bacteroides sp.]
MEINGITKEELNELSDIDSFKRWQRVERYFPETRYIPDGGKIKTGVISIPPRRQAAESPYRRLYSVTAGSKTLLLMTDDIRFFDREVENAAFADRAFNEGGVYVSYPVEVGPYADETRVYGLYNFFTGENLARRLPTLYVPQQHELGIEAGKQLKKLHALSPSGDENIKDRDDIFILLTKLEEKGIKYAGFKEASEYLKKHADIVKNRPVRALHGDFSANTLFLDKGLNVGMFPFTVPNWGDPIKDLTSLQDGYSLPFIKGVFKGMFDGAPPSDFFELLAFYSTERALSDIELSENDEERAISILRAQKIASDLENYQSIIPIWY